MGDRADVVPVEGEGRASVRSIGHAGVVDPLGLADPVEAGLGDIEHGEAGSPVRGARRGVHQAEVERESLVIGADGVHGVVPQVDAGGQPFALDRSSVVLTVISDRGAVEIHGCPAPSAASSLLVSV